LLRGLDEYRKLPECHVNGGNLKEALTCYGAVPNLDAALKLVREMGEHPAAGSLEWMSKLRQLASERPEKFTNQVTAVCSKKS
jgi:hypothetical protein